MPEEAAELGQRLDSFGRNPSQNLERGYFHPGQLILVL